MKIEDLQYQEAKRLQRRAQDQVRAIGRTFLAGMGAGFGLAMLLAVLIGALR